MTTNPLFARSAMAVALLAGTGLASAQHASSLPPPSYSGTIESRNARALVVSADPFDLPQRYAVTDRTACVDENGRPVSADAVRQGALVTVYSGADDGDALTATKVVVRSSP